MIADSSALNKKLSFFLPFYNEEDNLEKTVKLVLQVAPILLTEFEILLINDGSNDSSLQIAERLRQKSQYLRIFSFEKNQGFGAAYISGLHNARFDHALYLTTDGDVGADELKLIIQTWDGKNSVLQYAENPRSRHLFRFVISKTFVFITNFLSNTNWPYYNGFNIYSLKNKDKLKLLNFGFATQAYALLTLFETPQKTILLATKSRFNDSKSKAITLNNIYKAFLFFYFIIRNRT